MLRKKPIIVEIPYSNSTTHIGIFVDHQIDGVILRNGIAEMDTRSFGIQLAKKRVSSIILFTGQEEDLT